MFLRLRQGNRRNDKKLAEVARLSALGRITSDESIAEEIAEVDEALAIFGLVAERAVEDFDYVYLWPVNIPTWNMWQAVSTQWNDGMNGATGLDYAGVEIAMRLRRIKRRDQEKMFADIQAMEIATLRAWAERKND